MAFNDVVMRSILALDAYNRGVGAKIQVDGYQLGNAALGLNSGHYSYPTDFFAQTYTWNGSTIISYRGTDGAGDIARWLTGIGDPDTAQSSNAIKFYQDIAGNVDTRTANIELVRHSLGGGLAGFVGSLFGVSN